MKKTILNTFSMASLLLLIYGCAALGADEEGGPSSMSKDDDGDYDAGAGNEGSDLDVDTDTDTDTDMDSDADDGYPPEIEEKADYKVPQGSGRYVFIADEAHDAVVVVDSETLNIEVVDVGSRPTHLVPLGDNNAAMVLNLDSDEVTLLRVNASGKTETLDLDIRPDTNALAASDDGRYVIAFHDPQFTAESGAPNTDQEITVIETEKSREKAHHMTVGMHPWKVVYNSTGNKAYVITEEGINIIDLEDIENIGIPPIVSPFGGNPVDPGEVDIEITPDGSLAVIRQDMSGTITTAALDDSGDIREYALGTVPTDLDIANDGSFGLLVLRSLGQIAFFDLPLPDDPEEDPFEMVDLEGVVAGVATITPDGKNVLLHTTTAGTSEDQQRLSLLSYNGKKWNIKSVLLERKIRAVASGVDSQTSVVIHQKTTSSVNTQPYSYSLVKIPVMQVKFQQIPVEPGQLLLTPEGNHGFLLLEPVRMTEIIYLDDFIVDRLQLGSAPTAAGYTSMTQRVFIAQDHPAGRMTFIELPDMSIKTVTGYALNDEITE